MADKIVLELKGLNKSFNQGESKIVILNDASFSIKKGEIVALIGPSGTGKSTLLYTAGLLDKADSGDVIIDGKMTSKLSDNQKTKLRCKKIGFVYQQHNLFADFTAGENVMLPLLINGVKRERALEIAKSHLEKMGLINRINHRPMEMSGGEQQRVAIARALANSPMLLLADEPTGNLDPYNSEVVFENLLLRVRNDNMTAFIATHNPILAKKMDRKIALVDGKLVDIDLKENMQVLENSSMGRKILEAFK
ncbi:MAG: ABC transporter ATP-binding protein [Alphaproteobacteria bacterium]|nr:ABC transporter ATP-binding protein [Alphaproteobacteria bacterium]